MKRILIGFLIIGIAGILIVAGIMTKPKPPKKVQVPAAPLVETVTVNQANLQFLIDSQGPVKPKIESNLVAEASGQVIEVSENFRVGAFVSKGDILFKIDPANYTANLRSAEATLAQAKAAFQEANARTEQARKDWKKIGKGEANDLVLKIPQLNQAKANVQSANAALLRAQRDLSRTKVRASFDALIKSKSVDLGQYVNTGTMAATLYGTEKAEVRLPLPDREIAFLNLPEQGVLESYPDVHLSGIYAGSIQDWYGKVVRTEGVVDEANRLTYLVAEISDPYNLKSNQNGDTPLRFGTFVNAKIAGIESENLIALPRTALINKHQVLTIIEESKVQITDVTIARSEKNTVYVSAGLVDGQEVIITPIENPINKMLIKKLGEKDLSEEENNLASEDIEETESSAADTSDNIAVSQ